MINLIFVLQFLILSCCGCVRAPFSETIHIPLSKSDIKNANYGTPLEKCSFAKQDLIQKTIKKTLIKPETAEFTLFSTPYKKHIKHKDICYFGYGVSVFVKHKDAFNLTSNLDKWIVFFRDGKIYAFIKLNKDGDESILTFDSNFPKSGTFATKKVICKLTLPPSSK